MMDTLSLHNQETHTTADSKDKQADVGDVVVQLVDDGASTPSLQEVVVTQEHVDLQARIDSEIVHTAHESEQSPSNHQNGADTHNNDTDMAENSQAVESLPTSSKDSVRRSTSQPLSVSNVAPIFSTSSYTIQPQSSSPSLASAIHPSDASASPQLQLRRDKIAKGKGRERRASRRSIRVTHKKNLLGDIVFKGHPSWVLMLNIQTGIRNSVGKQVLSSGSTRASFLSESNSHAGEGEPPHIGSSGAAGTPTRPVTMKLLTPADFSKAEEFYNTPSTLKFPSEGSPLTIPHTTGPFKFKDYCPLAFRFLRHRFGVDPAEFMVSVCNTLKNGDNALRVLPTPGKSGSLFFFSHDMQYILKTIPKDEAKLLRFILPSYVEHVAANENTLLPKFFGMYRVKPHAGRQVRFIVMNNIFPTLRKIHERFDLKGSTAGREASPLERQSATPTFKDLDFIKDKGFLSLGGDRRTTFCEQLRKDSVFLEKLNIMDYSLLVGVHYEDRDDPPSPAPARGAHDDAEPDASPAMTSSFASKSVLEFSDVPASPSMQPAAASIFAKDDGGMLALDEHGQPIGERYYLGIIDILMLYSPRKKLEHAYKAMRFGAHAISSVSPVEYSNRFIDFVSSIIH